jgi:two-component system invasion response regulator UvrY
MVQEERRASGIRVLIADDHYVVRQGLKQILAERFKGVRFGEASTGNEALELVWKEEWDVVLLDINMPGRGGLDALKEVKQARPKLPVIILSMLPEEQFAVRVLKLGACAYIRKDSAGSGLVTAVEAAIMGQAYITPGVANKLALHLQENHGHKPHEALTDREYQVFCLIGSGLTVKEVADRLSLSVKTISTYRVRALVKMGMRNNSQITHYVVRHQLGLDDSPQVTN